MVATTVQSKFKNNTTSLPKYMQLFQTLSVPSTYQEQTQNDEVNLHRGNWGRPTVYHYQGLP